MKKIFSLFCLLVSIFSFSQELVLIKFKDKPSTSYFLSNPAEMLTQKALDRRTKYGVSLSENDVPVEIAYVNAVRNLGISIIAKSKWFNGVFAEVTDVQKSQISALSYVSGIESFVKNTSGSKNQKKESSFPLFKSLALTTDPQINQINLKYLHDKGYKGSGMTIAILDAGFPGVNTASAFDHIRPNIKGGYNFVDNNGSFYLRDQHGTEVLSTIGGYLSGQYNGTAPDANFYLYITEKKEAEIPEEEAWWIAAAEKSDSLGVDIINSSLGYNTFDDSRYNYTLANLDGKTSFISRGAQTAADKGIFVVVAAGNEGDDPWKKITVPADAQDVFTVGAVNSTGSPGNLSSYGPTADGRVKPDVSALGISASFIYPNGNPGYGSGTSFSSPIIAGAVACLMQAYPTVLPSILRQKIRESASQFTSPTEQMGYGIPNFATVFQVLDTKELSTASDIFSIYPNPVKDGTLHLKIVSDKNAVSEVSFFNYTGQLIYSKKIDLISGENQVTLVLPPSVQKQSGLVLRIKLPNGKTVSEKLLLKN